METFPPPPPPPPLLPPSPPPQTPPFSFSPPPLPDPKLNLNPTQQSSVSVPQPPWHPQFHFPFSSVSPPQHCPGTGGQIYDSNPNQNNAMMWPPSGAYPHFEQEMRPSAAMIPPPPAQGAWPSFPPAQMMNHGIVNNNPRPLDLGMFPPWQLTVTLPSGEIRHINIPYSEGNHVIGLPLGSDVPEVIASNYKDLLCMVNGMACIITNLTRNLDRYKRDAARYWDDVNCYRLEVKELKSKIAGGVAVPQEVMAPVSPSKKRKMSTEESGPCETKEVCISQPEHLPPPRSDERPDIPVLQVQESVTEEDMDAPDDSPPPSVQCSRGEEFPTDASLYSSDVETDRVESVARAGPVVELVDATIASTPTNCLTVDSTTLTISTPMDINPSLIESTSVSGHDEGFEYVENFKVPKEYAVLYKKIFSKYGHMVTKKVIKFNDAILLACVTSLLKIASKMETVRGMDLSVALVESWEGDIQDAETLRFNIGWLREKFDRLKNSWKSSFEIDEDVENLEQVLDAAQMKYVDLYSRKDKLEADLSDLKTDITESGARISAQREAIREKLAQKNTFVLEPVLGDLFSDCLEVTD